MESALQLSLSPEPALDERIERVLAGLDGPWNLSGDELTLLRILQRHKGAENALPIVLISQQLGLSPRGVKSAVKSLVEDFRLPIGGSRQEPYGYFFIVSTDDMELALRPLVHELESIGRRVRALKGMQGAIDLFRQVEAKIESDFHHRDTEAQRADGAADCSKPTLPPG